MMKTAFLCNAEAKIDEVYGKGRRQRIGEISDLYPTVLTQDNLEAHAAHVRDVRAVFSTWGMPVLDKDDLDRLPALEAVFYAAGSVKRFAPPLLDRGIIVMSAWAANAVPVAEFTLAQILLANKGYFRNTHACSSPEARAGAFRGPGNFGETVAVLGAGRVGRTLIGLLKGFALHVIVWDPFLGSAAAAELGVEKIGTLKEAFSRALAVSNHLANVEETQGLFTRELFEAMRPDAVFINTGRGATVVEPDMIAVLQARQDLTALLDVTCPEPPAPESPLWNMPNVHLSAHLAGSIHDETVRMADVCIEEFLAWEQDKPLQYAVTREMLATLA